MLNQFKLLASYNQLMNQRLYEAASQLSEAELKEDKGAFFKSIFGTLNHILVADILWLNRFSNATENDKLSASLSSMELPKSLDALLFNTLNELKNKRVEFDHVITEWISSLSVENLKLVVTYKNMLGKEHNKSLGSLINHLLLHQIHHRGQVTTLLSQADIDFGETDLIEIIPERSLNQ